jgi:hypothetical protein
MPYIVCAPLLALAFAPTGGRPSGGSGVAMMAKSQSLPFLEVPAVLDGSLPGDVGFDPLGFTKSGAQTLTWMREAELKHGRICMLAMAGWITVDLGIHFPGPEYEGLRALTAHSAMVESGNMAVLLMIVSVLELVGGLALWEQAEGNGRAGARSARARARPRPLALRSAARPLARAVCVPRLRRSCAAGDYSFDPLNYATDKAILADLQLKEIKNGRLAMIAFSGLVTQAALTGKNFPAF